MAAIIGPVNLRKWAWLPQWAALASIGFAAVGAYLHWRTAHESDAGIGFGPEDYVIAIAYPLVGALLVHRRPNNALGWAFALTSFMGFYIFCAEWAVFGKLTQPGSLPLTDFAAWIGIWGWIPHLCVPTLIPLIFPNGLFASNRWRYFARFIIAAAVITVVARMFAPIEMDYSPQIRNPLAVDAQALNWIVRVGSVCVFLVGVPAAVVSLLLRTRKASGVERTQLLWLLAGGFLMFLDIAIALMLPKGWQSPVWAFGLLCVPASVIIAVLRYQLFDVEFVFNRSIVYVIMSALVLASYLIVVRALASLDFGDNVTSIVVAITALTAASFRRRIQAFVDRALFGYRNNPYDVVNRVGERLDLAKEPNDALATLVSAVTSELKLPYAAVIKQSGDRIESGKSRVDDTDTYSLVANGREIGLLIAGKRFAGEKFGETERLLLADVARRASALLHSSLLLDDLRKSRERIVTAREAERVRLRNDLHDGVGPELAAIALQLDALTSRAGDDLKEGLGSAREQVRSTVKEIRRVVADLRPTTLDELGLVGAVEAMSRSFAAGAADIALEKREALLPMSAAAELAAYRICAEGINNVVRHSGATTCSIDIVTDANDVVVSILDNGHGIDVDHAPGVGLQSMRERAEELGGTFDIASTATGTSVIARIPRGEHD